MGESVYVSVVYCVWACLWTDGTFTNNIFRMAWQLGNPCQTEFIYTMDGVGAVTMLCHARLVHNALSCFGHVYFCTELPHCKHCLAMYVFRWRRLVNAANLQLCTRGAFLVGYLSI